MNDLFRLSATEAHAVLDSSLAAVSDLTRSCLDRIAEREPLVHAWAHIAPAQISLEAHRLDDASDRGKLHGLPIGIKDVILTEDMPTGYNTPLFPPISGGIDAACVAILREAGALIFGKTETVEFASIGRPAPTANPHNLSRTPGGSSSGSAAAVADFHVPLALGTQTAGSIMRPASYCGVYGFKPSWGLVSKEGAKDFSPTLDTIGWFARSAADLRLLFDVLVPSSSAAPVAAPRRIGLCKTPMWDHASETTQAAMANAAQRYLDAGYIVTELDLPPDFAGLRDAQSLIMFAEGGRSFLPYALAYGDALHPRIRSMVSALDTLDPANLRRAYNLAASCRSAFDDLAADFDAVLAPSTVGEAPDAANGTGDYIFNGIWTLLHTPCLNLPWYRSDAGLPVGVTLTGPRFSDQIVLKASLLTEITAPVT